MQKKAREDACKMLEEGLGIELISRITGLSPDEIKKLGTTSAPDVL